MITIDTEKAMIHGVNGSTFYSTVDGFIEIYDPKELTDSEYEEAIVELAKMIDESE